MAPARESAAFIALLRIGSRPWPHYADAVEQAGSAERVLEDELAGGEAQTNLLRRDPEPLLTQAGADLARWQQAGIGVVSVLDADYPHNLRAVHDRPPILFTRGAPTRQDERSLAIIGSRRASETGRQLAAAIAEHLVAAGFTVVSGLAAGIDTAAHRAALDAGGRTIAVIGTGLCHAYPPENAELQREIATRGAVVSQFWPSARPTRISFPQRNATMSGLALGTVIVEASLKSGARIQARRALAHGRPVFLLAGLLTQDWAQQLASRPGTHVVEDPERITDTLDRLTGPLGG
jgi:DNA processing protein